MDLISISFVPEYSRLLKQSQIICNIELYHNVNPDFLLCAMFL